MTDQRCPRPLATVGWDYSTGSATGLKADQLEGVCNCIRCQQRRGERFQIMALCPTCGNKRCPKATFHGRQCTGSNEPGQKGSDYRV